MRRTILAAFIVFQSLAPMACGQRVELPGKFVFDGEHNKRSGVFWVKDGHIKLLRPKGMLPVWSPEGDKIACSVSFSGHDEKKDPNIGKHIYILDENGNILKDVMTAYSPGYIAWSPDEKKIAYIADDENRKTRLLYLYDLEKDEHQLIYDGDKEDQLMHVSFSPDGTRLLFYRGRSNDDAKEGTYVMNIDSSGLHRITGGMDPSWYPDGQHILVFRNAHEEGPVPNEPSNATYFYKVNVQTGKLTKGFDNPGFLWTAKLSRNGKYFYYTKDVGSKERAIFVMPLEGPDKGKEISVLDPKDYGYHDAPDWYIGE